MIHPEIELPEGVTLGGPDENTIEIRLPAPVKPEKLSPRERKHEAACRSYEVVVKLTAECIRQQDYDMAAMFQTVAEMLNMLKYEYRDK